MHMHKLLISIYVSKYSKSSVFVLLHLQKFCNTNIYYDGTLQFMIMKSRIDRNLCNDIWLMMFFQLDIFIFFNLYHLMYKTYLADQIYNYDLIKNLNEWMWMLSS